jgi:Rrf2 family protein
VLKITKKVEYSLIALKFMAAKELGGLTSARELCDAFGMPFDTMAKVLQSLNHAGWLSSVKGIKGGYTLTANLSQISFMQLTRTIEGKEVDAVCMNQKGLCELYAGCNIIGPIGTLHRQVSAFLENLSLDQLLSSGAQTHLAVWEYEEKSNDIR